MQPISKQWLISDKAVQLSAKERAKRKNKNKLSSKQRHK